MMKIQGGFFCLPNDLFKMDLDPFSFMIYAYLISIKGTDDSICLSALTISRELKIPESVVSSRLQSMEEQAYVYCVHTLDVMDGKTTYTRNMCYKARDFEKPWCQKIFSHKRAKKF